MIPESLMELDEDEKELVDLRKTVGPRRVQLECPLTFGARRAWHIHGSEKRTQRSASPW